MEDQTPSPTTASPRLFAELDTGLRGGQPVAPPVDRAALMALDDDKSFSLSSGSRTR